MSIFITAPAASFTEMADGVWDSAEIPMILLELKLLSGRETYA